jgi:RNA polymerase-binding transcription factor DksA
MSALDSSVDLIGRPAPDGRDSSVVDALVDLNLASIERHIHEIRAIKTAKERIHNGTYGTCERCSRTIDAARLLPILPSSCASIARASSKKSDIRAQSTRAKLREQKMA